MKQAQILVEMMNEIGDAARLQDFADKVRGGVVPLRGREHQDEIIKSVVALLANGIKQDNVTSILMGTHARRYGEDWCNKITSAILKEADSRITRAVETQNKEDFSFMIKAAMSFSEVIETGATPSAELQQLAISFGGESHNHYNQAGLHAMTRVMGFLRNPEHVPLAAASISLMAGLNNHLTSEAERLAGADIGEHMIEVEAIDDVSIMVTLSDGQDERTVTVNTEVTPDIDNSADTCYIDM